MIVFFLFGLVYEVRVRGSMVVRVMIVLCMRVGVFLFVRYISWLFEFW